MLNFKPILLIVGFLLAMLSVAMLVPALVDYFTGERNAHVFIISACITLFFATTLILSNNTNEYTELTLRQVFLLTTLSWVLITGFGALPLALSNLNLTYADAYFETMSGITTTGSTVLVGLDEMDKGILLWRAIMQWMGGIGIIVMGIAILPMLRVGGMQLFKAESSDTSEKVLPRAGQIAKGIGWVYLLLTIACGITYRLCGMTGFEAACHAMSTVSTAGFSTSDSSIGHFSQPSIHWAATFFMFCGGIPFTLYVMAFIGKPRGLFVNAQVRTYFKIILFFVVVLTLYHSARNGVDLLDALRVVSFNVVSAITTTGFTAEDYTTWGPFSVGIFFVLYFIGGCTGSTAGAVKIFRYEIMANTIFQSLTKLKSPNEVHTSRFGDSVITAEVRASVMAFFALYISTIVVITVLLTLLDLDLITALSGAVTAVGNVGPGLGPIIGPAGTFAPLPEAAKIILAFGMLLGRLELLTVFVLLMPGFWKT